MKAPEHCILHLLLSFSPPVYDKLVSLVISNKAPSVLLFNFFHLFFGIFYNLAFSSGTTTSSTPDSCPGLSGVPESNGLQIVKDHAVSRSRISGDTLL